MKNLNLHYRKFIILAYITIFIAISFSFSLLFVKLPILLHGLHHDLLQESILHDIENFS